MRYKKNFIIVFAILIAVSIYYRDYIPTTRADLVNLYYFFTDRVIPTEDGSVTTDAEVGSGFNPEPENSRNYGSSLKLEPTGATEERVEGSEAENVDTKSNSQSKLTALPESINNFVPFTPQAPFANWDALHEEACEEASLAMAHYFMEKRELVLSKEADKDITDLAKYINKDDITITEVQKVAEDYYKYSGWKIEDNPGVEEIKKILASGKVVIAPMAGRELGNPNFKQPGPLYHMLVISGYNNKGGVFITQDPGTRKGKNYEYKFNILMNALHDFPGDKNKIKEGYKKILIVS